jgi:hypothetical protein
MEAGEVADEAAPGVAVRLTADRAEVARRAVSLMVETIDADQNSRAAMMVRCSTMDFWKEVSFDSRRFNLRLPLSRGRLSRYSSYTR